MIKKYDSTVIHFSFTGHKVNLNQKILRTQKMHLLIRCRIKMPETEENRVKEQFSSVVYFPTNNP